MNTTRIIARNIFSNWVNLAVTIVIGFFMMPFLVHRLGDTLYGIWALVISLVGYGNLFDFGVRTSIVKYVSQHYATEDRHKLRSLLNTTLAAYAAVGLLVFFCAACTAFFLPHLFRIPSELKFEAQLVLLIIGFDLALKFPGGVFQGFLSGLQRYELANGVVIGCSLLRAALTVVIIGKGGGLIALSVIVLTCDLLMSVVMVVVCLHLLPWLSLSRRYLSRMVLRNVYTYGLWSSAIALASRILYYSDSILIGMFFPAAVITHFAVANNLVRYLRQLAYGFGNVFNPAASDLEARSEHERLKWLLTYGTRYALAVVLPAALLIAILGREFLALWMGPLYAEKGSAVLRILVLSQIVAMAQFPAGAILYGLNRHRYLSFILLGEAILKVALSFVLLPSYGILGAAVSTAAPEILASFVLIPVTLTRCVGVPIGSYFRLAFLPPALGGVALTVSLIVLNNLIISETWALFMSKSAAGLTVYTTVCFFTCFSRQHREEIRRIVLQCTQERSEQLKSICTLFYRMLRR